MQTIWQLSEGDAKSIPALTINMLWDSIPYLVHCTAESRIFSSNPEKEDKEKEE
jgi:hypothetical protein